MKTKNSLIHQAKLLSQSFILILLNCCDFIIDRTNTIKLAPKVARLIISLRFKLALMTQGGKRDIVSRCVAVARLLGLSQRDALKIVDRKYRRDVIRNVRNRLGSEKPRRRKVCWRQKQQYLRFTDTFNTSRMLTTIHMGDFWFGYGQIAGVTPKNRKFLALRRQADPSREKQLLENLEDVDVELFRVGERSPMEIVRKLRSEPTTLACLCDMTSDFGEVIEVEFLGKPAFFAKGPAELAIVSRVPIIPFVTYEVDDVTHIETDALIDTTLLPDEALGDAVRRITQKLVEFTESWVLKYPDQWHFLYSTRFQVNPKSVIKL